MTAVVFSSASKEPNPSGSLPFPVEHLKDLPKFIHLIYPIVNANDQTFGDIGWNEISLSLTVGRNREILDRKSVV